MASIGKNGQPSMDEILASIRRIVADDPAGAVPLINLNRKTSDLSANGQDPASRIDDSGDFELPSMFRPGHDTNNGKIKSLKQNAKSASIGRLTDAIRSVAPKSGTPFTNGSSPSVATREQQAPSQQTQTKNPNVQFGERPEQARSLSTLAKVQSAKPCNVSANNSGLGSGFGNLSRSGDGVSVAQQHHAGDAGLQPLGRSAETFGGATNPSANHMQTPAPNVTAGPSGQQIPVQAAAGRTETPRVMAPFRDTRMNRMSAPAPAQPKPLEPGPVNEPSPVNQNALNASGAHATGIANTSSGQGVDVAASTPFVHGATEPSTATAPIEQFDQPPHASEAATAQGIDSDANPPPLPETGSDMRPANIDDATADLLRPMLRQWLSENMPRMVEKALHIEVAASVNAGKPRDKS